MMDLDQVAIVEKLLAGLLVALIGWAIKEIIAYFVRKSRLEAGLLEDILFHAKEIQGSVDYVQHYVDNFLKVGAEIDHSARYSRGVEPFFQKVFNDLPKYFSRERLRKILNYYRNLEEFRTLMEGFFLDITEWKENNRTLSTSDVAWMQKKAGRIYKLGNILAVGQIDSIDALPASYKEKLPPQSLIS